MKPELLAPAGSYESLTAALNAGADAVYAGGIRYGARAYANNFDTEALLKAIDYVHLHGKRFYLTVNTLMKEMELNELEEYLLPLYRQGLDAVIVQDLGALHLIRQRFPGLSLHASTQMTVTGSDGAALLQEKGVERVVTARELSLEEIREIYDATGMEIEVFVHGALCYCYSGQCLLSSLIGGRSGNRGRCAQPCRLPYTALSGKKDLNPGNEKYLLSPKDMCTLDILPLLQQAGAISFKIEGRMKSPRYTAGVVSIYRKYLDRLNEHGGKDWHVNPEDRRILLDLFDRGGFSEGYFRQQNGRDMIALKEKPAFREADQDLFERLDRDYVGQELKEKINGKVMILKDLPATMDLTFGGLSVHTEGRIAQSAQKQPLTDEKLRKQMLKTGNTPFIIEKLEVELSENLFMPIQELNELRRQALESLEQKLLSGYRREDCQKADPPKAAQAVTKLAEGGQKQPKLLVQVESKEQFEAVLSCPEVKRIELSAEGFSPAAWKVTADRCHQQEKECFLVLPHIFRDTAKAYFKRHMSELKTAGFDGYLVRSLEEPGFLKANDVGGRLVSDHNLYTYNKESVQFLQELGFESDTIPLELNEKELRQRGMENSIFPIYGFVPVMVSAQCISKTTGNCPAGKEPLMLKDRKGILFPVKPVCRFCYMVIYNERPYSLLADGPAVLRLNPAALRLTFTMEAPGEVREILTQAVNAYSFGKQIKSNHNFTRGHFRRGVE